MSWLMYFCQQDGGTEGWGRGGCLDGANLSIAFSTTLVLYHLYLAFIPSLTTHLRLTYAPFSSVSIQCVHCSPTGTLLLMPYIVLKCNSTRMCLFFITAPFIHCIKLIKFFLSHLHFKSLQFSFFLLDPLSFAHQTRIFDISQTLFWDLW